MFSSRSFMISGLITFFIVLFQATDYSTVNYCCSFSSMPFRVLKNFFRTKPTAVVYRTQTYKLLKDFQPPCSRAFVYEPLNYFSAFGSLYPISSAF